MVRLKLMLVYHGVIKEDVEICQDSWKMYFDDGLTPSQAIREDLGVCKEASKFMGGFIMESLM